MPNISPAYPQVLPRTIANAIRQREVVCLREWLPPRKAFVAPHGYCIVRRVPANVTSRGNFSRQAATALRNGIRTAAARGRKPAAGCQIRLARSGQPTHSITCPQVSIPLRHQPMSPRHSRSATGTSKIAATYAWGRKSRSLKITIVHIRTDSQERTGQSNRSG